MGNQEFRTENNKHLNGSSEPTFTEGEVVKPFTAHVALCPVIIGLARTESLIAAGDALFACIVTVARSTVGEVIVARAALVTCPPRESRQAGTPAHGVTDGI